MSSPNSRISRIAELTQVRSELVPGWLLTDMSRIQHNFYELWQHAPSDCPVKAALSKQRPFYDFIDRYLLPEQASMKTNRHYWKEALVCLSRYWFKNRYYGNDALAQDATSISSTYHKIDLPKVAQLASWLQKTFRDLPDIPHLFFGGYYDVCHSPKHPWRLQRRLIEAACAAMREHEVQDESTVKCILNTMMNALNDPLKPRCSPVTSRNLGAAWVEFLLQYPVLQTCSADTIIILFAHWCYRKKRRFALAAGIDQWLGEYYFLKSVPFERVFAWLPEYLWSKINTDCLLPANKELTAGAIRHILAGKSVRTMPCLPFYLSPKAAHWMMQAPRDVEFNQAVLYGRARALCPDNRLAQHLSYVFYKMIFTTVKGEDEMWGEEAPKWRYLTNMDDAARFFGKFAAKIDRYADFEIFIHYLKHQWEHDARFTLQGRTPASLRRLVQAWHTELAVKKINRSLPLSWSGIRLRYQKILGTDWKTYRFRQMNNQRALLSEGAEMRHCVGNYIPACAGGRCSIWSMYHDANAEPEHRLTIEINARREIVQVRGMYNRRPHTGEHKVLEMWIRRNGLRWIAPYE